MSEAFQAYLRFLESKRELIESPQYQKFLRNRMELSIARWMAEGFAKHGYPKEEK